MFCSKKITLLAGAVALYAMQVQTANAFDVPYPNIRFKEYWQLTDEQKNAASTLGYTQETWDQPGSEDFEYLSYWYMENQDYYDHDGDQDYYEPNPTFKPAAEKLGFVGDQGIDQWDCWQSHYYSYSWDDLVEYDIASFYEVLGWNQEKWDAEDLAEADEPATSSKMFYELSPAEKTAAVTVCYTQKLWDYDPLPFCKDSPHALEALVEKGNPKYRTCHWMSKNLNRCDNRGGNFSKHCPNTCGSCNWNKCEQVNNMRFFWNRRKSDDKILYRKCKFVAKGNTKQKCRRYGIKETCPKTCGVPGCATGAGAKGKETKSDNLFTRGGN